MAFQHWVHSRCATRFAYIQGCDAGLMLNSRQLPISSVIRAFEKHVKIDSGQNLSLLADTI